MNPIVFTNVRVFDGSGRGLFPAEVRVEGELIQAVAEGTQRLERAGAQVLDGQGMTLMPGMVEAHAHLTWPSSVERVINAMKLPAEEHLLRPWADANPRAVASFRTAIAQAVAFAQKNPEAAKAHLAKYVRLPPEVLAAMPMPRLYADVTESQLQFWVETMAEMGLTRTKASPAQLIAR